MKPPCPEICAIILSLAMIIILKQVPKRARIGQQFRSEGLRLLTGQACETLLANAGWGGSLSHHDRPRSYPRPGCRGLLRSMPTPAYSIPSPPHVPVAYPLPPNVGERSCRVTP